MERPASIVRFEQFYLGAFVLGGVNTALSWQENVDRMAADGSAQMLGPWFLPAVTAIGFLIPLLLWFFAARKGAAVAKWIIVVLFVLGVISLPFALFMGTYPMNVSGIIGLFTVVLQFVAIIFLFRPDTKSWFGETKEA